MVKKLHKLLWISSITFVLLIALICLIAWIYYSENPVSKYSTYNEAVKKGVVGPGRWLPVFLPKGAIDIEEIHNIDRNEQWISFTIQKNEVLEFTGSFIPVMLSEAQSSLYRVSRRASGWPKMLKEETSTIIDKKEAPLTYQTSDGAYGIAIDFAKQRVFIWSTTKPSG